MNDVLVIDIETVANPTMEKFVAGPPEPLSGTPPKNYKKEETIRRWHEDQVAKEEAKYQERLNKMALDVDYARIAAIGTYWCVPLEGKPIIVQVPRDEQDEAEILRDLWGRVEKRVAPAPYLRFCGYNIRSFDLPIILRRSWQLGVKPSRMLNFRRYATDDFIDLMDLLYGHGSFPGPQARSLKAVAEMYGIENEMPDAEGSQVAEMDTDTLRAYCASDVRMTLALAQMTYGYYWR